jgi:hypothetical protein
VLADPPRSRELDLTVAIVGLWFAAGLIFDSWAHLQIGVESFFTPYHAIFYSAMVAGAAALAFAALKNRAAGFGFSRLLPLPYRRALLGVPIFVIGGLGDFVWHTIFSTETRIEAVISPTHVVIGLGVVVFVSGPIASALSVRTRLLALSDQLPLVFALATVMEFVHLGTSYAFDPAAARNFAPPLALATSPDYFTATTIGLYKAGSGLLVVILQASIVSAFAAWLLARFRLAFGAFMLLFVLGEGFLAAALSNQTPLLIVHLAMAVGAGLSADCAALYVRRRGTGALPLRYVTGLVALAYCSVYFVVGIALQGTWWDWNLILGSTCYASLAGFAIGMLAQGAPPVPAR